MSGGPASSPSGAVELVPEEAQLGGTPAAAAANAALRALSRAARAFALYDSKNAIIRRFIGEYRAHMEGALSKHGAMTLKVEPFELSLGAEVVYREEDRERSLAFRLFRDGVRTLTLHPGLPWEECVQLLEILSLRFSGVRQQEDDVVTLLRRAAFTRIELTAVEGFSPTEDHPEPPLSFSGHSGQQVRAPADFDLPLPDGGALGYGHREVPPKWFETLRSEEAPAQVPALAVRLCIELLREANGPASPLTNAEVGPLCTEVRDYCIADGAFLALLALVRELKSQHGIGSDVLKAIVDGAATHDAVLRLLDALPETLTEAPPGLIELLAELPGNQVLNAVERLNEVQDARVQKVLQGILVGLGKKSSDSLLQALPTANVSSASTIVAALMESAPTEALSVARELVNAPERDSHLQALAILEKAPRSDGQSELLVKLASNPDDHVFARTAQAMAAVHDRRGYDVLARQAEARAKAKSLSLHSATALGEALAALSAQSSFGLFKGWAQGKGGLLGKLRVSEHDLELQRVAVAGLAMLRAPEAEALIKDVGAHTHDETLKAQCISAINKRRKLFPSAPGSGPSGAGGPARG